MRIFSSNGDRVPEVIERMAEETSRGRMDRREFLALATTMGASTALAYSMIGVAVPVRALAQEPKKGGVLKVAMSVKAQKDPRTYETIQGTQVLSQGNGFLISFTVTPLSVSGRVNPHVFVWDPVSLPSSQKWIFLGYKGLRNAYHIEGTFLNFELK